MEGNNPSGKLDFPSGLKVIRSYRLCHFLFNNNETNEFYYTVNEPGECILPNGDRITFEYSQGLVENSPNRILLNKKDVSIPIIIRTKEPGDRMSLKGMEGTKKIKRIFIDQKIPIEERARWPIVTDSTNRILWLPGLKKCHDADTVNIKEMDYILLTYKHSDQ
jgi:tRNA(Ile)-lysidine synthetase-like protein